MQNKSRKKLYKSHSFSFKHNSSIISDKQMISQISNRPNQILLYQLQSRSSSDKCIQTELNAISQEFQELVKSADLGKSKPPFLFNTFTLWREQYFKKFNQLLSNLPKSQKQKYIDSFNKQIDDTYFFQFTRKMKKPYFDICFLDDYEIPEQLDPQLIKNKLGLYSQYTGLACLVANWCIQIEITADLIDRAKLYQLYYIPRNKKDIVIELKNEIINNQNNQQFNLENYTQFLLRKVTIDTFTERLPNQISTICSKNGIKSKVNWQTAFDFISKFFDNKALPWFTSYLSKISITWMFGEVIGWKTASILSNYLRTSYAIEDIQTAEKNLLKITNFLIESNFYLKKQIKTCLDSNNDQLLKSQLQDLNFFINKLLNIKHEYNLEQTVLKEKNLTKIQDKENNEYLININLPEWKKINSYNIRQSNYFPKVNFKTYFHTKKISI